MKKKKRDMILIYGECNKNYSAATRLCHISMVYADNPHFPKILRFFSQFNLTKRMTFMLKFTKVYIVRFFIINCQCQNREKDQTIGILKSLTFGPVLSQFHLRFPIDHY
jgi:hypothetical protein